MSPLHSRISITLHVDIKTVKMYVKFLLLYALYTGSSDTLFYFQVTIFIILFFILLLLWYYRDISPHPHRPTIIF